MVLSPTNTAQFDHRGRSGFRMKWEGKCVVGVARKGTLTPVCGSSGAMNPQVVSLLRQFHIQGDIRPDVHTSAGSARTGPTADYSLVRRLEMSIETSVMAGTQWAAFERNTPTLWGKICLTCGTFMQTLFLQGSFQGSAPTQAYFVKCDAENNPSPNQGIVNILVGFAPLLPAEFVVIPIQQLTGG